MKFLKSDLDIDMSNADSSNIPVRDSHDERWRLWFGYLDVTASESFNFVDLDNADGDDNESTGKDAEWRYVHIDPNDNASEIIGRYAILLQDEAGKININTAGDGSQNEGWTTYEIDLQGIPGINAALAQAILDYRFQTPPPLPPVNPNQPGGSGDDDGDNSYLSNDGIDNNADGTIDEVNEGTNEPDEYYHFEPWGDDLNFSSVEELVLVDGIDGTIMKQCRNSATAHSSDSNYYYNITSGSWTRKMNINFIQSSYALYTFLQNAILTDDTYGNVDWGLQYAANIMDYTDRDHVMTMNIQDVAGVPHVGLGIEGIQINEVSSNPDKVPRLSCPGAHSGMTVHTPGAPPWNTPAWPPPCTGEDGAIGTWQWDWDNGTYKVTINATGSFNTVQLGDADNYQHTFSGAQDPTTMADLVVVVDDNKLRLHLEDTDENDEGDPMITEIISSFQELLIDAPEYIELINISTAEDIDVKCNPGGQSWALHVDGIVNIATPEDGQPITFSTTGTVYSFNSPNNNQPTHVTLGKANPPTYNYVVITDSLYAMDYRWGNDTGSWGDNGDPAKEIGTLIVCGNMDIDAGSADLFLLDENGNVLDVAPEGALYGIGGYGIPQGNRSRERYSAVAHQLSTNWADATCVGFGGASGTPGYTNCVYTNSNAGNNRYWQIKDRPLASIGEVGEIFTGKGANDTLDIGAPYRQVQDLADKITVSALRLEAETADSQNGWALTGNGLDGTDMLSAPNAQDTPPWKWTWTFSKSSANTNNNIGKEFRLSDGKYDAVFVGKYGHNFQTQDITGTVQRKPRPNGHVGIGTVTVSNNRASITIYGNKVDIPYFDYLILSPIPATPGRINLNTASKSTLMALPGITSGMADDILNHLYGGDGIPSTSDDNPIDTIGELLDTGGSGPGIAEDVFKNISNLITTRSDIFKIIVKAQSVKDRGSIGAYVLDSDDIITATCTLEAIVDRSDYPNVKILYLRYREE